MNFTEREFSTEEALAICDDYLKFLASKHGISVNLCLRDTVSDYPTYTARAEKKSLIISEGHGKGEGIQSKVSATFELIEHLSDEPIFFSEIFKKNYSRKVRFLSKRDFFNQSEISELEKFNRIKNLRECDWKTLPMFELNSMNSGEVKCLYPYNLITYNYPVLSILDWANRTGVESYYSGDKQYKFDQDTSDVDSVYLATKYSSSTGGATWFKLV